MLQNSAKESMQQNKFNYSLRLGWKSFCTANFSEIAVVEEEN